MSGYVKKIREKIGHDPLLICGAGIIVYKDGKILMQKRRDDGTYGYIGGCVELYEEVEQTARRELFEETGLTAGKLELFGIYSGENMTHVYPNKDEVSIVDIVYICTDFTGTLITETDETVDCRWFDIDGLPDDISNTNRLPLMQFVRIKLRDLY